jgi:hypothetical protein
LCAELPGWLQDVLVPGVILYKAALQPPLGEGTQGVVVSLVGGGFSDTGSLFSGDRYSAVATLVQVPLFICCSKSKLLKFTRIML